MEKLSNTHQTNCTCHPIPLSTLMQGKKKIVLEHAGRPYLLSITRRGRLILTAAESQPNNQAC
jgi:hemin uptake protein HemP